MAKGNKKEVKRYYKIWSINDVSIYEVNFEAMKCIHLEICPGVYSRKLVEFDILDSEKFIAWMDIEGFKYIEDVPYECLLKGSFYELVAMKEDFKAEIRKEVRKP